jgi:hypothetical protein
MTEAENDKTKAVPDGGHVSANMARENGKLVGRQSLTGQRSNQDPISSYSRAICCAPQFGSWKDHLSRTR